MGFEQMSVDYTLFRELTNSKKEEIEITESDVKPIIKYQEYELTVENKQQIILIPLRECNNFEATVEQYEAINKLQLRKILYKHRGIRKK